MRRGHLLNATSIDSRLQTSSNRNITQEHSELNCLKPHFDILTLTQILPEKAANMGKYK